MVGPVARCGAPQFQEHLLGDLLGLGVITHHRVGQPQHRRRQPLVERGETIPVTGAHREQQLLLRGGRIRQIPRCIHTG